MKQPDAKEIIIAYADMYFDVMDVNKDGVVTYEEYYDFDKSVVNMDDETIDLLFKLFDKNQDGVIDREEKRDMILKYLLTDE